MRLVCLMCLSAHPRAPFPVLSCLQVVVDGQPVNRDTMYNTITKPTLFGSAPWFSEDLGYPYQDYPSNAALGFPAFEHTAIVKLAAGRHRLGLGYITPVAGWTFYVNGAALTALFLKN